MVLDEVLRDVPLFSQLRDADLAWLGGAAHRKAYPKNAVILLPDDPADALYVVLSGQVKLVVMGEDGREVIISTRGTGDFFGEMALIDDLPQATHAIAMEDTELLVLRRSEFHTCVEQIPQITFGLLRAFCRRLRKADKRISSLTMLDVPQRVAHLLLELADENDGVHVTRQLTHHVMAQIVGSSRETVSRAMRELVSRSLIDVTRQSAAVPERRQAGVDGEPAAVTIKVITIKNRQVLEAAAGRV